MINNKNEKQNTLENENISFDQKNKMSGYKTFTYKVENLNCANCAAKIEKKINELQEIDKAVLVFQTKKLKITGIESPELLEKIRDIADSIEDGVCINSLKDISIDEDEEYKKEQLGRKKEITIGLVVFIVAIILEKNLDTYFDILPFLLSYIIVGKSVISKAGKNIFKGKIFDENFLMTIATLGAFAVGEYPEAVGVMIFYKIGEFIEESAVQKSKKRIEEIVSLNKENVILIENGKEKIVKADALKVNDIIVVKAGSKIPVDGVIIDGETTLDTSPLTGENMPVEIGKGEEILSGNINLISPIRIKVKKELKDSTITKIADAVTNAVESKPKIERFITKFAEVYTPIVVLIAVLTAVIPSLITQNWQHWIYIALTFLVISCPCALVLSIPMTYFAGVGAAAKEGILLKGGNVFERIKGIKNVVFDKTGTLTVGEFEIKEVMFAQGLFEKMKQDLDKSTAENYLMKIASMCEISSEHPIARSIVKAGEDRGIKLNREILSDYKVEEKAGKGIKISGNGKSFYCGNKKFMQDNGVKDIEDTKTSRDTILYVAEDKSLLGCIIIADSIKKDSLSVVEKLKQKSFDISIITGDTKESAEYIGKQLNVDNIYSKVLPHEKLNIVNEIREKNGGIIFVGDGINDAPVLAGADVGIAMGDGMDLAINAADVVLVNSNTNSIIKLIDISKRVNNVAISNIVIALGVKSTVLILGILGIASMWLAVFADSGVAAVCILNSLRVLSRKNK